MEEKQGRNHGFNVGGSERGAEGEGESQGAEGAEEGGAWGGGVPIPTGRGVWGGGRASSPEIFLIFYLKMVSFGAFWVALPRCM